MTDAEIISRTVLAAALIQTSRFDLSKAAQSAAAPLDHAGLRALRDAVDVVYRAVTTPG